MSTPNSGMSIAQQMLADGSLPDMPTSQAPMRAVVAAAATVNPDAAAQTQRLAQQAGIGSDLARSNPQTAQQIAVAKDLDRRQLEITNPILARQLENPDFASMAHDDLDSLSSIGLGARVLRETESFAGNVNSGFFGAFKPLLDMAGTSAEALLQTPKAALDAVSGVDPDQDELKDLWLRSRTSPSLTERATGAVQRVLQAPVIAAAPQSVAGPVAGQSVANPAYKWWGRPLVNTIEQVPGALAAFGLTGKLGGAVADAAGADGTAAEAQSVPAILGTQSAQTAYTQARAKGADQKTAVLAALSSGVANYAMMGQLPGGQPTATALGALGQWATRSAAMGTGMAVADNAIARSYDPDRKLMEGVPQSIANMAAFEGVGSFGEVMGHISDAVQSSKLMKRSPEAGQGYLDAQFEGQPSLRIPAQDFVNYFAEKKLDPAVMANQAGVTNLDEAAAAGSDLEIPKANFFGKLAPEHQKGLLPDVIDPSTGLSARQAEAGRQELADWAASGGIEKLQAEYEQADAETQATPEWQKVYSDLKQRYVDAGETETAAEGYATLQANAIANLAKGAGLKPDELLALHNPQIVAGEAPEADQEHASILSQSGDFGPVHDQFYHDAQGAIERLLADKNGEAVSALHHPEIGDIDLVYGRQGSAEKDYADGYGLAKIARKHPDVLGDLQGFIGGLDVESRSKNRIVLADPDRRAIVRLSWDGNEKKWLLTAYHREEENSSAVKGGRTGVTHHAEPAPPASQVADNSIIESHSGKDKVEQGVMPGDVLHQSEEQPGGSVGDRAAAAHPRGWFRMLGPGRYEIGKTAIGDMSTFIHEPAHAYLEMWRDLSGREGVSDPLREDFKKITEWLGTTPEEVRKNGFTREQHEQWARANEQYVRDGNAPTSGLRRAFHNFSVWLGSVYRRASSLGVELSPEIRGVMDRLYAGEDAVHRAEQEAGKPLFASHEEAGWTEAEYRNYAETKGIAVDKAREQVRAELNAAAEREQTQQIREEKSNVRDAVTQEIDARPEYTAIRSLRRGSLDDGTELTLNRDALVRQFGEERVQALQKLHRGIYRNEGGTDAETAAEMLGFNSGEEMMRALESAPRRAQAIEAATRDYLVNKYGDVRYDGTLTDRARFALENEERAGNIYRELRTLRSRLAAATKKAADAKAAMAAITTAPLDHYRDAARAMIDNKPLADLQPNRYLDASRRYSRDAFDALRRGDTQAAAEAKNKELLNHFLFREATKARDYADRFESYAKRVQSRGIQQRLGLADENAKQAGGVGDYRDQFNWLLARYGLSRPMAAPERSLRDWAEEVYGQGNEPAIAPDILNGSRFADYRSVPLSEVRDLHDALVNIRHLAQQEFKMYVQGKQIDFVAAKNSMIDAARENLRARPEKVFDENHGALDKVTNAVQYVDARLMRMERLFDWLDGGKHGPWHESIWDRAADAQGDEYDLQEKVTKQVTDALAEMPEEMRRRLWTEKLTVDGISEPLPRRRLLSMAFNMGNEGNLDRLRKTFDSFGWDRGAIEKIGGMLTREEWQFVQRAWDSLKPLGERMQELERRLTGLPPAMVKTTPFRVALADGTEMDLAGGYFPIAMDPRFSQRAIEQDSKQTAQNAMQSGYVRATTSKGYTKERTGFGGPLLLDYERVLTSHVAKVAKDLSHREFMLATQRLLLDTDVRRTLRETLGPRYEEQFMPWLRTIINDNNGSVQEGLDSLKDGMQALRANIVASSVGFNFSTALLQISHAPRMLLYARPASLVQSLADLLARPVESAREIRELSPNEMRFRGDSLNRDIRSTLQEPSYRSGYTRKVAMAARFSLEVMDHVFSHTLWRAAYNDALAKYGDLSEAEAQRRAVHEADSAVRLGVGTSAPKDLPAIMRSSEFNKFITTLYGFHNGVYNQLRENAHQFRYGGGPGKLTYATILTAVLPAVLGAWLTGHGPEGSENAGWWAAKRALLFSADTIPVLRSVASYLDRGGDVQFSPIEGLMQKGAKAAMEASSEKDDKDWMGIGLNAADVGAATAGVPGSHQAVKALRYAYRAQQGKIEHPNMWDAMVSGR